MTLIKTEAFIEAIDKEIKVKQQITIIDSGYSNAEKKQVARLLRLAQDDPARALAQGHQWVVQAQGFDKRQRRMLALATIDQATKKD